MEVENPLFLYLSKKEKALFRNETIKININRGKLYSKFIIFIQIIFSLADIFLKHDYYVVNFKFNIYLALHLIMVSTSLIYLFFLNKMNKYKINANTINFIILSYAIFMMVLGAVVSLFDQKINGQVMEYMINVIIYSIVYYIDNKNLFCAYFISAFILFLGLPFFQDSKEIISDDYIYVSVFLICLYITSRILYKSLYNDLKSKRLIIESNIKLKNEVEESKIIYRQLEKTNKMLKKFSLNDELTSINNRRALREFIGNAFVNLKQYSKPISVIMMDIDNFKLYNDKYGHIKGDEVLRRVSSKLKETLRDSRDFVARYGGEEFIFIALETNEKEIYKIAYEIREKIYNLKIPHEYSTVSDYVTISLGIATTIPRNSNSIYECIKSADTALYKAKLKGKNRIVG